MFHIHRSTRFLAGGNEVFNRCRVLTSLEQERTQFRENTCLISSSPTPSNAGATCCGGAISPDMRRLPMEQNELKNSSHAMESICFSFRIQSARISRCPSTSEKKGAIKHEVCQPMPGHMIRKERVQLRAPGVLGISI